MTLRLHCWTGTPLILYSLAKKFAQQNLLLNSFYKIGPRSLCIQFYSVLLTFHLTLSLDIDCNSFFSFSNSCSLVTSNSSFLASLEDLAYRGKKIDKHTINAAKVDNATSVKYKIQCILPLSCVQIIPAGNSRLCGSVTGYMVHQVQLHFVDMDNPNLGCTLFLSRSC